MPPAMKGAIDRAKTSVQGLSRTKQIATVLGALVAVALGFVVYTYVTTPTYQPVFTNLSDADAAAVTTELEASSISYQVPAAGTISVPKDDVYTARMLLAEKGLPGDPASGYALLDSMGMTSSDFQQEVTYKRALEGELAKTVATMQAVESAQVKLAIPKDTVFAAEVQKPTASVVIKTKAGGELNQAAVESIVYLVSRSVPNMEAAGVAVVDTNGKILTADGQAAASAQGTEADKATVAKVQAMLDTVVGPGNAKVSAKTDVTQKQVERTSETYSRTENVGAASEQTNTEEYTGGGPVAVGVLGPDNIAVPGGTAANGASSYNKKSTTVNNPINKVVERQVTSAGTVEKQSVSVVINSVGAGAKVDLAQIEAMVVAAAGIDPNRGDQVSVTRQPFDTTVQKALEKQLKEEEAAAEAEAFNDLITKAAAVAGGLFFLLIVLLMAKKRAKKRRKREQLDLGELDQLPAPITLTDPDGEGALAITAAEEAVAEVANLDEPESDPRYEELEMRRQTIAELAMDKPAQVAEQLRSWMAAN